MNVGRRHSLPIATMARLRVFPLWLCGVLCAVTEAAASSTELKGVEASDLLNGTFTQAVRAIHPSNCIANNVSYSGLVARKIVDRWRIPHSRIFMDGSRCGVLGDEATAEQLYDEAQVDVFRYKLLYKQRTAQRSHLMNAYLRVIAPGPLNRLLRGLRVVLGEEEAAQHVILLYDSQAERKCGNTTLPTGTFTVLVRMGDKALDVSELFRDTAGIRVLLVKQSMYHIIIADTTRFCPYQLRSAHITYPIRSCFPANAHVRLANRSDVRIDRLQVGDPLAYISANGSLRSSPLLIFSHRDPHIIAPFTTIRLASGHILTISPAHFINRHTQARHVQVHDRLLVANSSLQRVVDVYTVFARGLYNPQPASGALIVNGVPVSAYTDAIPIGAAHALLLPLRLLHTGITTITVSTVSMLIDLYHNRRIMPLNLAHLPRSASAMTM